MARSHDVGPILATEKEICYTFQVDNPSNQTLRISKVVALEPCCSAADALPPTIPPRGAVPLAVITKPGMQSGRKRVAFEVTTDSVDEPIRVYQLTADPRAEVETTLVDGSTTRLEVGKTGRQIFKVVCNRIGDLGRGAPEAVATDTSIPVRRLGSAVEWPSSNGFVETTIEIEALLPASKATGARHSEFALRWPDGRSQALAVYWEISPAIRATPAAFVRSEGDSSAPKVVTLRANDTVFRVLRVEGATLVDGQLPSDASRSHRLRLSVPAAGGSGVVGDIVVLTDHPDQPAVTLSALALPPANGAPR